MAAPCSTGGVGRRLAAGRLVGAGRGGLSLAAGLRHAALHSRLAGPQRQQQRPPPAPTYLLHALPLGARLGNALAARQVHQRQRGHADGAKVLLKGAGRQGGEMGAGRRGARVRREPRCTHGLHRPPLRPQRYAQRAPVRPRGWRHGCATPPPCGRWCGTCGRVGACVGAGRGVGRRAGGEAAESPERRRGRAGDAQRMRCTGGHSRSSHTPRRVLVHLGLAKVAVPLARVEQRQHLLRGAHNVLAKARHVHPRLLGLVHLCAGRGMGCGVAWVGGGMVFGSSPVAGGTAGRRSPPTAAGAAAFPRTGVPRPPAHAPTCSFWFSGASRSLMSSLYSCV